MDKESLIVYISKLNDRNLQRQQASGFTLWAIMGVFAYLILDLSDKIVVVYGSIELKPYLAIFLSGLSIFCFSIFLLILSLMMHSSSSGIRRLISTVESKSSILFYVPISLVALVFSFISFEAASLATTINISPWIFWVFSLLFALNGILPSIFKLYQLRKSSKAKISYPEISPLSLRVKLIYSVEYAILSIVILLFLYLTFQSISLPLKDQQVSLLIKTSIEIVGIFILFIAIFLNLGSSNIYKGLENLEMEIYLNDLAESEIREKLESEYIGIDIFKWISKRQEKLNAVAKKFLDSLEEESPKIEELKKIDVAFKHEIVGRVDEISNRVQIIFNEYISVCKETSFQFNEIAKQGLLDKEELAEINKVRKEWNSQIQNIENKNNEFFKSLRQACSRKL